mmetsp:Transcript_41162/g.65223  ORF Transcript_41162/g.65223 Transcript_41162/m.65223 type:complete len:202 (+) Transcript_41162:168-773(+)
MSVGIWVWKPPGTDIHLDRGNDQLGDCQLCIASVAHLAEFLCRFASTNVDVALLLISNGGLPRKFLPAIFRKVIVAHEDASLIWKCHDLLNGLIEFGRRAAWKVAASCAIVRHEKGVTGKEGIAHQVTDARRCVTGCVHHASIQLTNLKGLTIGKELVELRSILLEVGPQVEHTRKDILNMANVFTNGNLTTQLFLDVRSC